MSAVSKDAKRITVHTLQAMKSRGEKIAMLTAYDYSMARILDASGIDVLLVGDSASNVMAGHETTLPITLDQMIYHAQSVIRAVKKALVVVDLPFGSYQGNSTGHLGLTPQSIYKFGTYTVRAKEEEEAEKLMEDALHLQQLGCFAIVLEKIPAHLAKKVSETLVIPTIGIGAGMHTDGQVLVTHDMLGITKDFQPRFLRRYVELFEVIQGATQAYIKDVKAKDFPNEKEQY
jgi:3-methyl-2-oxobutanoate hydroxymethyltransferase